MSKGPFLPLVLGISLVLAVSSPAAAEEGALIQTNAREGSFRTGQRLWFSVPPGYRLKLLADGAEQYRGTGSAPLDLNAAAGEEREFLISAECYSPPPQDRLLEQRSFRIVIDRKAPEAPQVKLKTMEGGFLRLSAELPPGVKAAAYVDNGERLHYIPDLDTPTPLLPLSFSALIWAVDAAGNVSAPLARLFDFPGIRVENPAPGTWANPQRLLIFGVRDRDVFWTSDGSDPLGPGGKPYTGPELINKTGDVCLRVAFRHRDGFGEEEKILYRVEPGGDPASGQSGTAVERAFLVNLRFLEERNIRETTALSLPGTFRWSIGGEPRDLRGLSEVNGGNGLILRPREEITRAVPLHLSSGGGTFRFILTLDGSLPGPAEEAGDFPPGPEAAGERRVDNIVFADGGAPAAWEEGGGPKIISSGGSRVLVWSLSPELIRYSWNNDASWSSGSAPVCIPPGGGRLRWIIDQDDFVLGPFTANIESRGTTKNPDDSRGRYVYRYLSPENGKTGWFYASGLLEPPSPDSPSAAAFDVCDGEDIEWSFITLKGESRGKWRTDRLPPQAPVFDAPGEGQWRRGPVRVSAEASGGEGEVKKFITARIRYASGTVETLSETGPLVLKSATGEYAEVRLEARIEDASGNPGPPAVRNFILDPLTVYVSPSRSGLPGTGEGETGGRDRPFISLEEALEFARREGRRDIFLNGSFQVRKDIIAGGDLVIDGSFNERWERKGRTALTLLPGVSLTARQGTLKLRGLDMERRAEGPPFLRVLRGGGLEILDCGITGLGTALALEGGNCFIWNSRVLSLMTGESRLPAVRAADSRLQIARSDFSLEGGNGLGLEMSGGVLNIEDTRFRLSGGRTATALSLKGVRGELKNLDALLSAGDYCSALEIDSSELTLSGGTLSVSSRDAVAALTRNTEILFVGTGFEVKGLFVARALEAWNIFPRVTGCRFLFSGSSRRSEVFSGLKDENGRTVSLFPEPGTIGGNVFLSFTHVLGGAYPMESLAGFNRRFAPPGRPNVFREAAPPGDGKSALSTEGEKNDLLRN